MNDPQTSSAGHRAPFISYLLVESMRESAGGPSIVQRLAEIVSVLVESDFYRGESAETIRRRAALWVVSGFESDEVREWVGARCFKASTVKTLREAGISPQDAARTTRAGRRRYEDTIAHKIARGDLSIMEAFDELEFLTRKERTAGHSVYSLKYSRAL